MTTDPPKYWFPTKRYGWGWGLPATWQGWVAMLLFVAAVTLDGILFAGRNWPVYAVILGLTAAMLVAICWWKGEPPRWRWGN